jgi:barstar (barnase inhibitor)
VPIVRVPTAEITDWSTFHDVFARTFGFLDGYGRNMDAWVDCMTCADDSGAGLIAADLVVPEGDVLTLQLGTLGDFAERCPEQYAAIVECAAFVNWRRIEKGHRPILALSFYK